MNSRIIEVQLQQIISPGLIPTALPSASGKMEIQDWGTREDMMCEAHKVKSACFAQKLKREKINQIKAIHQSPSHWIVLPTLISFTADCSFNFLWHRSSSCGSLDQRLEIIPEVGPSGDLSCQTSTSFLPKPLIPLLGQTCGWFQHYLCCWLVGWITSINHADWHGSIISWCWSSEPPCCFGMSWPIQLTI